MIEISPALLARHDRPGPRYTSYPTAVEFSDTFTRRDHEARLEAAGRNSRDPLALYVHLPFCEARCSFCACHVVVTRRQEIADAYLARLLQEADIVAERLGERREVVQYHWGGGTPTYSGPATLRELHRGLLRRFALAKNAEVSIEVDPRVTTPDHLEVLAEIGFNRISLGVQDLDDGVQGHIGRNQTRHQTEQIFGEARRLGFRSINLDLVYGLPGQTEATMERTLDAVIRLRPDRLAVYSFAYVPWMRPHQRRIDESLLPDTDAKFRLLASVGSSLMAAGYVRIGMDHYALPADELVGAVAAGSLTRNFMGYTVNRATDLVALGTSGISEIDGAYVQNHRRLASYYEAVDAGLLPTERGYQLSLDDLVRRFVITELMCNGKVDLLDAVRRFEVGDLDYFAAELAALRSPEGLIAEGMARVDGASVQVTELGALFVRRVAAVFDAHASGRSTLATAFSRTV